ncbi:DBH-like monooxygenase protein 1 homolog [Octopus bimaculoides]|nr:DBH-like monooxygenase protein 1 homolog [Octopus bimaculoides]|eukprot:XP_014787901.1 PREDICTED: DBH-like monooxygenase protein 1 homolog [Octopus bimaculoides]
MASKLMDFVEQTKHLLLLLLILASLYGTISSTTSSTNIIIASTTNTNYNVHNGASITTSTKYFHSLFLDPYEKYRLSWKFNKCSIQFQVRVNSTGYVGFGLSPDGSMRNSDIIIGGVKDGKPYFSDYHGIRNGKPKKDKIRNWKLKEFDEHEGFTTLVFSRKFETNDIHDMNITTSTMRVIWSFGESDDITYHTVKNRGTKSLYLLQKPQPDITMPQDGTKINFLMNMLPIPEKHTTYWCKSFIVPRFSERKHIIQVSPKIQKGNEMFVHHMLLYECFRLNNSANLTTENECYLPNMAFDWTHCRSVFYAWAIGGGKFTFPEQAGMSIGTSNDPVAFILEIHYDNPLNLKGHFDSSGIEMILIPAKRKYDAAMVEIGYYVDAKKSPFSQLIPPFVRNFRYFGYCLPNCQQHLRRSSFPRRWKIPGIKIFGVLLHSHLLGRKMALHHYRNGTILPPIVQDSSYDFNYQEMKFLHRPVTVLMGDILKVECVYDSTNIRNFTYGGQSTKEEMCLAYILYYPKINLTNCLSASESNQWKIEETGNLNFERFKNENVVKEFERKANSLNPYSSLWSICGQRGEIKFQGPHFTDHIPEDTSPISMFSSKKSVCKRRLAPRKPKTTTTKTEMFTSLLTSTTEESQGPVHHINVFLLTFPLIINYELTKLL